jgi:DNA-binding NarL/FixJ family response regulator
MQGQRYFSPEVMEQLAQVEERGTADCDLLTALTDREVDVLRQLIIEKS